MYGCTCIIKIVTPQVREFEDHRLVAFDWSTQTVQLAAAREEWRCCTTGHGVLFVMTLGPIVMPELLAGAILYHLTILLYAMNDNKILLICLGCLGLIVQFAALAVPGLVRVVLAPLFGWMTFNALAMRLLWTCASSLAGDNTTVATMRMPGWYAVNLMVSTHQSWIAFNFYDH